MSQVGPATVRQLLDEHGPALVLYARQWCLAPEDVVQQAMLKLFRQRQLPDPVVPWLYRVVRNEAISVARSNQRRQRRESRVAAPETWFTNLDDQLDGQTAVEALAELPIDVREVIVARIWGGLTLREIAEVCGKSIGTVRRRYESGLSLLREQLGVKWLTT